MMQNKSLTFKIVSGSICAALVALFTGVITIPLPQGYFNLGDMVIFTTAFLMPSIPYYVAAAGIGSGIADLISGYATYAPATVIIKSIAALTAAFAVKKCKKKLSKFIFMVLAVLVVPFGYFVFEIFLYGFQAACVSVPFNLLQATLGAVFGSVIGQLLNKKIN